ncbi:LysR family transcriptional regulator [Pararhizobium haloflavum]|uniref:LysR family transcriptional regulator n=1 Tax=Pararhizobium haloflavum TaxID=2037914 RepID=UPI000C1751B5|nr:LysR family transcriptional regulator [Pararhizobium haloflavum]
MSVRGLRSLKAIIDHHSFANAARALNMTPSAISMQIVSLEQSLGVVLFDRRYRPPRLTRVGETVLHYARTIVDQHDTMVERLADVHSYRDYFRLSAVPTVLISIVTTTLMALKTAHPNLVVNVTSNLSGELENLVDIGEVDGALMHRPKRIDDRFDWRDVCRQQIAIVAPPDSTETDPAELFATYPYIRFNRSAWVAPLIEERLAMLGISPDTNAEIESLEAIHKMVELGFGISVLPDIRVRGMTPQPYRVVEFGEPAIYRRIGMLTRKSMHKKKSRDVICDMFEAIAIPER